jgi:UTP-glucose-1-phosphate uridylyltransferase
MAVLSIVILKQKEKTMLSVQDHPLVQKIDDEILKREAALAFLQTERVTKTKALLKSTYQYARVLCQNLNIQQQERAVALLFGYEYLTNIQMVEQWLLEQLVELNQCEFCCPTSELQNRLLVRLNSLQQDAFLY